jgi:hypothetical protein
MIEVLHMIRRASDGATVVLVDHTGLGDQTRTRGGNAQKAGVHTECRVFRDEQTGLFTAEMTRDKAAGPVPARWYWRLERVEGIEQLPHRDPPVTPIPMTEDAVHRSPVIIEGNWWDEPDGIEVPEDVRALRGRGRAYALVIFRILRWVARSDGMSGEDLKAAIASALRAGIVIGNSKIYDRTQANRALALLEGAKIIEHPLGATAPLSGRWALADGYGDHSGATPNGA